FGVSTAQATEMRAADAALPAGDTSTREEGRPDIMVGVLSAYKRGLPVGEEEPETMHREPKRRRSQPSTPRVPSEGKVRMSSTRHARGNPIVYTSSRMHAPTAAT